MTFSFPQKRGGKRGCRRRWEGGGYSRKPAGLAYLAKDRAPFGGLGPSLLPALIPCRMMSHGVILLAHLFGKLPTKKYHTSFDAKKHNGLVGEREGYIMGVS